MSPAKKKTTNGTTRTKKSTAKKTNLRKKTTTVNDEEIRLRAFQIYQQRGSEPGRDLEDWLAAEAELCKVR